MLGGEHRSIIRCPTLVEHFYPRVPNLNVVVASAELLKADMTLARSVLDGQSGGATWRFTTCSCSARFQVLDNFTVEQDFDARAFDTLEEKISTV